MTRRKWTYAQFNVSQAFKLTTSVPPFASGNLLFYYPVRESAKAVTLARTVRSKTKLLFVIASMLKALCDCGLLYINITMFLLASKRLLSMTNLCKVNTTLNTLKKPLFLMNPESTGGRVCNNLKIRDWRASNGMGWLNRFSLGTRLCCCVGQISSPRRIYGGQL